MEKKGNVGIIIAGAGGEAIDAATRAALSEHVKPTHAYDPHIPYLVPIEEGRAIRFVEQIIVEGNQEFILHDTWQTMDGRHQLNKKTEKEKKEAQFEKHKATCAKNKAKRKKK